MVLLAVVCDKCSDDRNCSPTVSRLRFAVTRIRREPAGYTARHEPTGSRRRMRQWREQLDAMQYQVTRHAPPPSALHRQILGPLGCRAVQVRGLRHAAVQSGTKFDAGCGWPSYWQPINSEVIRRVVDSSHGMVRVEVRCNQCGSTWATSFEDGPEPTGERSTASIPLRPPAAAKFKPAARFPAHRAVLRHLQVRQGASPSGPRSSPSEHLGFWSRAAWSAPDEAPVLLATVVVILATLAQVAWIWRAAASGRPDAVGEPRPRHGARRH